MIVRRTTYEMAKAPLFSPRATSQVRQLCDCDDEDEVEEELEPARVPILLLRQRQRGGSIQRTWLSSPVCRRTRIPISRILHSTLTGHG
jgi:hypothetical protein